MRTRSLGVLMFLFILSLSINYPTKADYVSNYFKPRAEEYYIGAGDHLVIENLTAREQYGLLLGANLDITGQKWENFTATEPIMKVGFSFAGFLEDFGTILIELYQRNTTADIFLDNITLPVIRPFDQLNPDNLEDFLLVVITMAIIVIVVMAFIKLLL